MISHTELKNLPDPRTLLGSRLFGDLQNLLIDTQRRGGTALRANEHVGLIFDKKGGVCVKVDENLTRIIDR